MGVIILTSWVDEADVRLAAQSSMPVAQVQRIAAVAPHTVSVDNHRGSFHAVARFTELGDRQIAVVGVSPVPPTRLARALIASAVHLTIECDRLSSSLSALDGHGLPVLEEVLDLQMAYDAAAQIRAATRCLVEMPASARPRAIFAGCDMLVAGMLQQRYALPQRVPVCRWSDLTARTPAI